MNHVTQSKRFEVEHYDCPVAGRVVAIKKLVSTSSLGHYHVSNIECDYCTQCGVFPGNGEPPDWSICTWAKERDIAIP